MEAAPPRRPWGPSTPAGRWDVIVVGGGMGGLCSAALLAHLGRRVLVLEQHTIPGGFTQSFRRGPWAWDVGLHVVGEMGPAAGPGRVLQRLTGERVGWTRTEGAYDAILSPEGTRIDLPGGLGALRASLESAFPGEGGAIRRYLALQHDAAAEMRDRFVTRRTVGGRPDRWALAMTPTAQVLAGVTENPRLRAVLTAQWRMYGTAPGESAFGVHAFVQRHFRAGGYFPRGGSMSIPRALAEAIAGAGGWTRVGADARQILVEHGRVRGVRLADGEEISAPVVIGAAGALNTLRLLPDEERRREWVQSIEALAPSCAHVCLNVGFRGDIRAAGASATNLWLLHGWAEDERDWIDRGEVPSVYVSFPSVKDGEARGPEGAHMAEIISLVRWSPFARWAGSRWRRRGAGYQELKDRISQALLDLLLSALPALRPLVSYVELSTPLSSAHHVRAVQGATYGLALTPERYRNPWLRPRTPVRGLYLAGADVAIVGVVGAMAGGLAAAMSVEPRAAMAWLREAVRPTGGRRRW